MESSGEKLVAFKYLKNGRGGGRDVCGWNEVFILHTLDRIRSNGPSTLILKCKTRL